ncbi:hypothetical protein GCM10009801_63090 [Streptomyces albiaxialis]|uniref:Uncharacterized protein n=1 Tax=Streptomyces albiaxialis TaxID=329523 RepID=A0ABP5I697_9ACTN
MPALPGTRRQQAVALAVAVVAVFALTNDGEESGGEDGQRRPGPHSSGSYPVTFDEKDSSGKRPHRKPGATASYPVTFSSGKGR